MAKLSDDDGPSPECRGFVSDPPMPAVVQLSMTLWFLSGAGLVIPEAAPPCQVVAMKMEAIAFTVPHSTRTVTTVNAETKPRSEKSQKVLLETEKLAILVSSYNKHFSEYCKGRRNVTQRDPSKVWKSVYADFIDKAREVAADCDEQLDTPSIPAERTLQDCLRCALDDQDTGTPDEKCAHRVTLQCEDTLQRLKKTDGHATRNMLRLRQDLIEGKRPSNAESSGSRVTVSANGTVPNSAELGNPGEEVERQQTKLDIQRRTADAIDRIASSISDTGQSTTALMKRQLEVYQDKNTTVMESTKQKSEMHKIETRKKQLGRNCFSSRQYGDFPGGICKARKEYSI
jgi:hypothetical protein